MEEIEENAYTLSQKLRELRLKEARLHRNLAHAKISKQRQRIAGVKSALDRAVRDIIISSETIINNASELANIINKNEDYIPLAREVHKPFQQLVAASTSILIHTSNESHKNESYLNVDLTTTLKNVRTISSNVEKLESSLHACSQFHNKMNNIISEAENTLQIKDVHKPRKRTSHLSESDFLNTFEANNISTSSQYEQIKNPHNS